MNRLFPCVLIFTGADIVRRIAVAKTLRKNLVKHRSIHPIRLPVIRQQHKIIGLIRQIGRHAILCIKEDLLIRHQLEPVLVAVLRDRELCRVIGQPVFLLNPLSLVVTLRPIGQGAHPDAFDRRIRRKTDRDRNPVSQLRCPAGYKIRRSVTVYAVQPVVMHLFSSCMVFCFETVEK